MEEILSSIRRIISEDGEQPAADGAAPAAAPAPAVAAPAPPPPAPKPKPKPKPALVMPDPEPEPMAVAPPPPPPAARKVAPRPERSAPMRMEEQAVLDLTEVVQDDGTVVSLNRQPARRPPPEPDYDAVRAVMMSEPEMQPPMSMQQQAPPQMAMPPPQHQPEPPRQQQDWGMMAEGLVSRDTEAAATRSFAGLGATVSAVTGMPLGHPQRTIEELVRELLRPMLKQWLDRNLQAIVALAVEREISCLSGRADKD